MSDTTEMSKVAALLESLEAGDVMREADAALAEVLAAVELTGDKGSLTITVGFERKRPGLIIVRPKVTEKIPREELNAELRFLTKGGELTHDDPSQMQFEFQNVTPMKEEQSKAK
jgi:hypothetical protein